jgi:DNA-binding phage protein
MSEAESAPIKTRPYDAARYLDSEEAIEAYLEAAFEGDDAAVRAHALVTAARARRRNSRRGRTSAEG